MAQCERNVGLKFGEDEDGRQQTKKNTQRSKNANENEGSETTEKRLKTNGQWTRPLKRVRESGNGGGASQARREREGSLVGRE